MKSHTGESFVFKASINKANSKLFSDGRALSSKPTFNEPHELFWVINPIIQTRGEELREDALVTGRVLLGMKEEKLPTFSSPTIALNERARDS